MSYKHGGTDTKLFYIWNNIKNRCLNPKIKDYSNYGGRGIIICPEWTYDYVKFKNWAIQNGYIGGLTINRIDNNGNYEPNNCNWITRTENNRNKRNNKINLEIANEIRVLYKTGNYTLKELGKKFKINFGSVGKIINNKNWKN